MTNFDCIHDADNGGVNRAVIATESQSRRTTLHDQDRLIHACADRVDGDQMAFLILPVDADHARDQQLSPMQPLVLARGDDGADDFREEH